MFQELSAFVNEVSHIALEKPRVRETAEYSQRRTPLHNITHQRALALRDELVFVANGAKSAFGHFIHEVFGLLELGHARGEALSNTEMNSLESHGLPKFNKTTCHARDSSLACVRSALTVQADVASKIETKFAGRSDLSFNDDLFHRLIMAMFLHATQSHLIASYRKGRTTE